MNVNAEEIYAYYFPVTLHQVENLLGKMLTHIEAMNLPDKSEKANKDLVRQSIWKWWEDAQENSMTSWKGCIGPIKVDESTADGYVWFTDVGKTQGTEHADVPWFRNIVRNPQKDKSVRQ